MDACHAATWYDAPPLKSSSSRCRCVYENDEADVISGAAINLIIIVIDKYYLRNGISVILDNTDILVQRVSVQRFLNVQIGLINYL